MEQYDIQDKRKTLGDSFTLRAYSQITPTNNPSTQHILETIPTATYFGCTNSYHQVVHKKIKPAEIQL